MSYYSVTLVADLIYGHLEWSCTVEACDENQARLVATNAFVLSSSGGAEWRFYHDDCRFEIVPEEVAGTDYLSWCEDEEDLQINHEPGAKSDRIGT